MFINAVVAKHYVQPYGNTNAYDGEKLLYYFMTLYEV
jgi:hypothetical protein